MKLFPLFCATVNCSSCAEDYNPDADACRYESDVNLSACLTACDLADTSCRSACNREYTDALSQCPCQENCPHGCPCPGFECPSWQNATSLLTLHWYDRSTEPLVIQTSGDYRRAAFDVPASAQIHYSCSLTWRNEMFIFGGEDQPRQINQIQGCGLERVGTLAFDHDGGGCASSNEHIYLCFSWEGDERLCRRSNGPFGQFEEVPSRTEYSHTLTGLAASDTHMLTVGNGGYHEENNVAELFSFENDQWSRGVDYPFHEEIGHMTIVAAGETFYVFGGLVGFDVVDDIARYEPTTGEWVHLGRLKTPRDGPGVKRVNESFMVIGGYCSGSSLPTEKCEMNDDSTISCASQQPTLVNYDTPEVFLVPHNFC